MRRILPAWVLPAVLAPVVGGCLYLMDPPPLKDPASVGDPLDTALAPAYDCDDLCADADAVECLEYYWDAYDMGCDPACVRNDFPEDWLECLGACDGDCGCMYTECDVVPFFD